MLRLRGAGSPWGSPRCQEWTCSHVLIQNGATAPLKRNNISKVVLEQACRSPSVKLHNIITTIFPYGTFATQKTHPPRVCGFWFIVWALRNGCLNLPKARRASSLFKHERWPSQRKDKDELNINDPVVPCCVILFSFFCSSTLSGLTLTADSVKNIRVKLSIKFIVLENPKGRRRFKIQAANVAICPRTWSLQTNKVQQHKVDRRKLLLYTQGEGGCSGKSMLVPGAGGVKSFAHNFFLLNCCQLFSEYPERRKSKTHNASHCFATDL